MCTLVHFCNVNPGNALCIILCFTGENIYHPFSSYTLIDCHLVREYCESVNNNDNFIIWMMHIWSLNHFTSTTTDINCSIWNMISEMSRTHLREFSFQCNWMNMQRHMKWIITLLRACTWYRIPFFCGKDVLIVLSICKFNQIGLRFTNMW